VLSCPLVKGKRKRKIHPKISGFKACHKCTQCFDSEESSGVFLRLYTNLGLSSNSPQLDKTVQAPTHPQTDNIVSERLVPAARAGLVRPCSGPVPTEKIQTPLDSTVTAPTFRSRPAALNHYFFLEPKKGTPPPTLQLLVLS